MKTSFILHIDSLCILDKMTDEQAGRFIKAIYMYQKSRELPELDIVLEMAITPFINQFFRDEKGYERVVERNRENGLKGGRPKKEPKKPSRFLKTQSNPKNPSEPKKADSDSDSDNDSVNDNEISFDVFWDLYDKKVGSKEKLSKAWNKIDTGTRREILEYVPKYKEAQPDKQYRKNPETFLNQKSWNDEIVSRVISMEPLKKVANWQPTEADKW